ncbi:uncharacterized protein LOC142317360 isoform X1 [Lycorma delicatula]|uniref:uncharacterized protein LOC142317360 isoform X1 n=1 Tax=Lycorma delicatula TaxID=130591 RepID=UPI003F51643D
MRAKILIFNLMMFNAINALLKLNPDEYTECTRDETLSYSCESKENCVTTDVKPTKNDFFGNLKASIFTWRSDYNSLQKLNNHFKIYLFEDTMANRNEITPTLHELFNKIPQTIMIKGGIIHTKGKSLISGINVKDLSIDNDNAIRPQDKINKSIILKEVPQCKSKRNPNSLEPEFRYLTSPYIHVTFQRAFITMDSTYVSVTYKCNSGIKRKYYRISEDYNLQDTVEVNDMTCFLQSNTQNETDKYNYIRNTKDTVFSGLHFEIYFSYICRLFVPVPVPSYYPIDPYNMPVYQSYRFTISGYHLKSENSHQITGLRYLVTQTPINNEIFPE